MDADVFLFPSRYDVFGLAVVEAMGAGLATVVSSLSGAVDDLCVTERNCLVVDGGRDEWATAIERLVGDSELRSRLGAAAARTIRDRVDTGARGVRDARRVPAPVPHLGGVGPMTNGPVERLRTGQAPGSPEARRGAGTESEGARGRGSARHSSWWMTSSAAAVIPAPSLQGWPRLRERR